MPAGERWPVAGAGRADARGLLRNGLHLAALSAFALALPLFDALGDEPEFFALRGATAAEIAISALAVSVGPALLLVGVEALAGLLSRRLASALQLVFVAALTALLALQALRRLDGLPAAAVLVAAALLGLAGAAIYHRAGIVRTAAAVLSPAALLLPAVFLLLSPVSALVLRSDARASGSGVLGHTPVVMVVFDELPLTSLLDSKGGIDARRYPNFARFARDATWFRNATGVHDRTTKAVPAMLDGRLPAGDSLPVRVDHPDSLFTLLGEAGYRMNVEEPATRLCPEDLCRRPAETALRSRSLVADLGVVFGRTALPEAVADRLPRLPDTAVVRRGPLPARPSSAAVDRFDSQIVAAVRSRGRDARFERWVARISAGRRPVLAFTHVFLPHVPWQYLPSGRSYLRGPDEPIPGITDSLLHDRFLVHAAWQRHLLQLAYTDRLLGRLLGRLRSQGIYDEALIVLVADHGGAFRPGVPRRQVGRRNLADLASVPLILKAPRQRDGRVDDAYVRTVDILPTIADLLDVRLPWRVDGRSAFDPAVKRRHGIAMVRGERSTIGGSTGFVGRASAAEFELRQAALLRRQLALFGDGDLRRVWGLGPNRGLLGRRVRDLPIAPPGALRAELVSPADYRSVRRDSSFLPALAAGRITEADSTGKRPLAVALNGRIAAVCESFFVPGVPGELFATMLPERAFREGRNRLEVYAQEPGGTLRPLGGA